MRYIRGGSWYLLHVSARAVCRGRNLPLNRNSLVGFRVVGRRTDGKLCDGR